VRAIETNFVLLAEISCQVKSDVNPAISLSGTFSATISISTPSTNCYWWLPWQLAVRGAMRPWPETFWSSEALASKFDICAVQCALVYFPGLPWIWNFPSISISISTNFPWIYPWIYPYPQTPLLRTYSPQWFNSLTWCFFQKSFPLGLQLWFETFVCFIAWGRWAPISQNG